MKNKRKYQSNNGVNLTAKTSAALTRYSSGCAAGYPKHYTVQEGEMDYSKSYFSFEETFGKITKLSNECSGIPSPTGQHYYASILFTRLCVSAQSLLRLSPHPDNLGKNAYWDYSTSCSITRNIIECFLMFYYLCVDDVDQSEKEARQLLFNLHDCAQRKRMFAQVESTQEKQFGEMLRTTQETLEKNPYFQGLLEKKRKRYIKGDTALFVAKNDIVKAAGFDVNEFRFLYRFLSNQVHSLPMSFYRVGIQERGRGVESDVEVGYTALCLCTSQEYLSKAYNGYMELFNYHIKKN